MAKSAGIVWNVQSRLKIYTELSKLRLSSFVILSSMVGYLFANSGYPVDWIRFLSFSLGGALITFSSNAINQLIERESDKLMRRTMNRPLPQNRVSSLETVLFVGLTAISGIIILTWMINPITGVLSALSLLLYGFLYTPLKRISSIAVFVGAIPGALPPLLGYVAFTNHLDQMAVWLFIIQFFWQFPHFWSIAWLSYEDYLKADIMLLPSEGGKSRQSAWITLIYTFVLIPLSAYPYLIYHRLSVGLGILILASIGFTYLAWRFYNTLEDKKARELMFGSFAYLLIFLISLFFL